MHGSATTAAGEAMYSANSSILGSSDNLLHDDDTHAHAALDTTATATTAALHDIESKGTAAITGLLLCSTLYTTVDSRVVVYSACAGLICASNEWLLAHTNSVLSL
jgi:hypothetical protein